MWAEYTERRARAGLRPWAVAGRVARSASAPRSPTVDATGLRGCIGTPEQARQYLRRYEEAGVDQVIFVLQAGRNRHEHIIESLELFGREVLPEFAERDPAAAPPSRLGWRRWSRRRSSARRESELPRALGDYEFPALPRQWADASGSVGDEGLARALRRRPSGRRATTGGRHHRQISQRAADVDVAPAAGSCEPAAAAFRAARHFRRATDSLAGLSTPLASASSR